MKYRTRTFYTETQKALMWERWREGESLHAIAQMFDRKHTSVRNILARAGRDPAAGANTIGSSLGVGRARRDLPRRDSRSVGAVDRTFAATGAEHGEPRDPSQRRFLRLPSEHGRSGSVATSDATQAL